MSYWQTQQEVHRFGPTYRHGFPTAQPCSPCPWIPSVAFLPWHREFVNRYEGCCRKPIRRSSCSTGSGRKTRRTAASSTTRQFHGAFGTGSPVAACRSARRFLRPRRGISDLGHRAGYADAKTAGNRNTAGAAGRDRGWQDPLDSPSPNANNAFSGGLESFSHNSSHVYIASVPNIANNNTTATS